MNKEKFVTGVLINMITLLIGSKLKIQILNLVADLMEFNAPGEQKKAKVINDLKKMGGELGIIVQKLAGYVLSLAIDIAVAYLKARASE